MISQFLFAYGTLKSTQPEHAQHCVPPRSITPARAQGTLWRLREGYPILQIDSTSSILDATKDACADWQKALDLTQTASPPPPQASWIEGELFEYSLDHHALHKMDTWENFIPGVKSAYQRRIIWVQDAAGANRIAWVYVCYSPPNWATMLSENCWNR